MSTMTETQGRRTRRSFTDDYKTGAVRLVLDEGKTVASAARDLGLTESSLRNWVEQARADRTKGKTGLTTAEREELARLRKEVRELRMERDVLKKAAVNSTGRRNTSMMRCCDGETETETVRSGGSTCDAFAWPAAGSGACGAATVLEGDHPGAVE